MTFPVEIRSNYLDFEGKYFVCELVTDISERKQAEEALRKSEQNYRQIVETAHEGIWIVDKKGITQFGNQRMADLLGITLDELHKQSFTNFVDKSFLGKAQNLLVLHKDSVGHQYELKLKRNDGSHIWVILFATPTFGENGQFQGMFMMVTDITDRKLMEENLHEQVIFMESLLEAMPAPVFFKDVSHIYRGCNQAFADLFALPKDAIIGKYVFDVAPVEIAEIYRNQDTELFQYPGSQVYESLVKTHTGTTRNIIFHKATYTDKNGQVSGLIGVIVDITEQKLAEESLRQREQEYKKLYSMVRLMCDNVPDLIWAKDLNGRFMFVNRAMCERLLQTTDSNEPINKTDLYFAERERKRNPANPHWHDFGEICIDSDDVVIRTRTPQKFDEFGNVKGEFLYLNVHKAPFLDESGNMIGTVGCGRDVTLERKMAQALRESQIQHKDLVDNAIDIIYTHDLEGKFTSVNEAAKKVLGYTEEEFLQTSLMEIIDPSSLSAAKDYFCENTFDNAEKIGPYEVLVRTKGGEPVWLEAVLHIMYHEDKPTKVHGIARDITDRKNMESALEKSERFLRQTGEIARVGGWIANPATDFLHWTDGIRHILEVPSNYKPGLEEGLTYYKPQYIPQIKAVIEQYLRSGNTSHYRSRSSDCNGKRALGGNTLFDAS